MKRLLTGLFLLTALMVVDAQEVTLTISNEGDTQRQEVVEADLAAVCHRLGISATDQIVIRNAFGQEVAYQKSYDGRLLLYVAIQPHGSAAYTITKGEPKPMKPYVLFSADDLLIKCLSSVT